jgi:choline kinase
MSSRAVILAAGQGQRMGQLTAHRPKAMLEVGGVTLVDRQLDALRRSGIGEVTVVVGYQHEVLRKHLGDRVEFVQNTRFTESNSLYSLWMVRDRLASGALILNADILVSADLISLLANARAGDAVLVDRRDNLGAEEMKVKIRNGFVVDFGKDLPFGDADAENVGIVKVSAEGGRRLATRLDALVEAGQTQAWAPLAFRDLAQEWPLRAVETGELPWMEIDFPDDFERAQREIAPAIAAFHSLRSAA